MSPYRRTDRLMPGQTGKVVLSSSLSLFKKSMPTVDLGLMFEVKMY